MSTTATTTAPAPPVGQTVFLLRWWDRHAEEIELFHTYEAALHALARDVRELLVWHVPPPAALETLTDADVVLAFYGGDGGTGGREAPTFGIDESSEAGFEIVEELIGGPEPAEVTLRLASLRVLDGDPDIPSVAYCLDAEGLTVAVSHDHSGYPTVHVTVEEHLSGVPITVRLEDPARPGGFEQTYRVA